MEKEEYDFYAESEVLERQKETMDFVRRMEKMRKHNRKSLVVTGFFAVLAGIGCIMLGFNPDFASNRMMGLWIVLALTLIFIPSIWAVAMGGKTFFNEYNRIYKSELVKRVLDEMFENVYYSASEGFFSGEVADMKVINEGDSDYFHSEDFIEGDYKGYHFAMSECSTCTKATIDNDLNITTFIGKLFDFDYNKNILFDVYIYGNNFAHPNKEQAVKKEIRMESINFGRYFHVHSSDDETAFYVLTPQLQEALLELGEIFHYDFAVTISGQRIFVALTDYRNTLEAPGSKKKFDYLTECRRIRQDMSIVTCLLEALPGKKMEDKLIRHSVPVEKDTVTIYEESGMDTQTKSVIELFLFWLVLVLIIIYIFWK